MARLSFECDNATASTSLKGPGSGAGDEAHVGGPNRPFPCAPDKYCFYCCCQPQCCFVIQRKPPKHFWEAWYFWLGVALLLLILLTTVGTYVVTNCKQNLQALGYGRNNRSSPAAALEGQPAPSGDTDVQQQQQQQQGNVVVGGDGGNNRHEISINVIPSSAMLPTHRKIMFIAPAPACTHLTPVVA